jgi:hypothetical protein
MYTNQDPLKSIFDKFSWSTRTFQPEPSFPFIHTSMCNHVFNWNLSSTNIFDMKIDMFTTSCIYIHAVYMVISTICVFNMPLVENLTCAICLSWKWILPPEIIYTWPTWYTPRMLPWVSFFVNCFELVLLIKLTKKGNMEAYIWLLWDSFIMIYIGNLDAYLGVFKIIF